MSERMKIPTPDGHVIDVEAPVLAAYAVSHKGNCPLVGLVRRLPRLAHPRHW